MSTQNYAAYLSAPKAYPMTVSPAPLEDPSINEILVKNYAVAINPIDGSMQTRALWPLNYPTILGHNVAGTVVSVGPEVTRFRIGDRVLGNAVGMMTKRDSGCGFQAYTILQTNMASHIPASISFEQAAVVPLGLSTAAAALFQDDFLGLRYPTEPKQEPKGEAVLIWGGSSSVGSNAIQLAVAAGYGVITTASPKNFDYVKGLGASKVFDHSSSSVEDDLIAAFSGKTCAGAFDCISGEAAWTTCLSVVHKTAGKKFVATVRAGFPEPPEGVGLKHVFATKIKDNAVGKVVYEDFLPTALETGTFVPSPEPLIAGKGLESVQAAIDLHSNGVSARKVIVTF